MPFPRKLAGVDHPGGSHIRRASIPYVGVMLPHDSSGLFAMKRDQTVQRVRHVGVAYVPRAPIAAHHCAVIALSIHRDEGVLLSIEVRLRIFGEIGPGGLESSQ